jgi:hypothetical protein
MAQGQNRRGLLLQCAAACAMLVAGLIPSAGWAAKHTETMVVEFSVKDFAAWRPEFDVAAPARAKVGITNARVFRDADKPEHLLVLFDVANRDKAKAWMTSSAVKVYWQKGGVVGVPSYHFLR